MLKHLDEVYRVLNAFCQTAGIGAICFDAQVNVVGCRPTKAVANDFLCLGTGGLTRFLAEKLGQAPEKQKVFYTYILEGNLASMITLIERDDVYLGAFVTQPVFLKTPVPEETDALIEKISPAQPDREALKAIIRRVPVRSFEKLAALGETLGRLSHSIFGGYAVTQVLCGETDKFEAAAASAETDFYKPNLDETFPVRQLRFADYLKLKDGIQSGDTAEINEVAGEIANGSMPTHQLDRRNYLRSLKDSYIKVCAMACYAAIEANAPYYKLLDLADEHIRRMEKLENAFEIFDLMKTTLFEFAHAVKISRIQTHSKAVRQILDYIDAHFDEKITLEMLAEHTGLSTFYLSSLIKKETGLILTDNVNAVRIEKSKKFLLDESLNIIDVAHLTGFGYQNHFSTVFKKFTGMTPSDYVKVMGKGIETNGAEKQSSRTVEIITEQLRKTISLLPEMYNAARVVDPRSNTSWAIKNSLDDLLPETCYSFWHRNSSCSNCISQQAFLQNKSTFKLEHKGGGTYLVVAIPKTIGKETYIIEVLKKVGNDIAVETFGKPSFDNGESDDALDVYTRENGAFYSRKELEDKLHFCMRRCRLENRPFSVILSLCEDFAGDGGFSASDLQQTVINRHVLDQAVLAAPDSCFAGGYTGDIVLLALGGTGYTEACRIAEAIENDFENMAFSADGQARFFKFYSGVKTMMDDIADENELINLALMELNAKIEGRTGAVL